MSNLNSMDIILTGVGYFGYVQRNIFAYLPDLLTCASAITLWTVAYSFCRNLEESCKITCKTEWTVIEENFLKIIDTSKLVNKCIGSLPFWYLIENTVYFSLRFQQAFLEGLVLNKWTSLLHIGSFMPAEIGMFVIAADICRQVSFIRF